MFLSSATDPYQPAEHRHEVTRRSLELLQREGGPVRVLTRSPLVERDLELLAGFDDALVGVSVPTVDDRARRALEPGAPPIEGRLRAVEALADAGLSPFVNLAPCYPLLGGTRPADVARRLAEAGVSVVDAGRWRYLDGVLPAVGDRVEGTDHEQLVEAVEDEAYHDRLFAALRGAFRRQGLPFRTTGP